MEEVILFKLPKQRKQTTSAFQTLIFLLLLTLSLSLPVISSAKASPADELGANSQQVGDLQAQAGQLDANYRQALSDLVAVDSEVGRYNSEIQSATARRDELKSEIAAAQKSLTQEQADLADKQTALEKRLRVSYKSDDTGYLEVMLGAGDFSEFLNRVDMINMIAEDDRRLIASINEAKQSQEQKLAALNQSQADLAGLLDQLDAAQSNLISAREEQKGVVASLQSRLQSNQNQISQLRAEAADIEARMAQMQNAASSTPAAAAEPGPQSPPPPAARGASFTMTATAYCLGGTTATGMPVGRGIIAVDPEVIPLGSRVNVSGYGDAIAADTGGAIVGNRIDVWLPCDEAYSWGVRDVTLTVY